MAIRPIDMQNMVPKLQEISRISQLEQQQASVNQDQISSGMHKKNENEQKTVVKSKEDEKARNNLNSKDQGRGNYHAGDRKKQKDEKNELGRVKSSNHKIDIKI